MVTPQDRYRDMVDTFGRGRPARGTCGMHVHVAIDSDEEGVRSSTGSRPWLPVLLAAQRQLAVRGGQRHAATRRGGPRCGRAGPAPGRRSRSARPAALPAGRRAHDRHGAARDPGMLYFDARLSAGHPTVEVRVPDVCTDPADARAARRAGPRAGRDRGRDGWPERSAPVAGRGRCGPRTGGPRATALSDRLVHPVTRELRPAREVLEALVGRVGRALEEAGDLERVASGRGARAARDGGASRQRAAYERTGSLGGVVDDLVARTGTRGLPRAA